MWLISLAQLFVIALGPEAPSVPWRQPQLAAHNSTVALAFGAGKSIYYSASQDQGRTFSTPVKVAESEVLALGRHRGPRVVFSGDTILVSAVTGKTLAGGPHAHGLPADGDLLVWRSVDGGKSWSAGGAINDVPGSAREGLHALAADGHGRAFAAWLDLRASGTRLYGAHSSDGGKTWSKNMLIYESPDGTICQCCHPSAAMDAEGQVLVMWRNCLNGARDMYLARAADGVTFSKPEKLGRGTWQLSACPMDGGGIALVQDRPVTAWRRGSELFLDRPGETETSVGEGKDIAVSPGANGVYAVWSSAAGLFGRSPSHPEPFKLAEHGAFPSVVSLPGGAALVAWEDEGHIVVQRMD